MAERIGEFAAHKFVCGDCGITQIRVTGAKPSILDARERLRADGWDYVRGEGWFCRYCVKRATEKGAAPMGRYAPR